MSYRGGYSIIDLKIKSDRFIQNPINYLRLRNCAALLMGLWLAACASTERVESPAAFNAGMENRAGLTFSPDGKRAFWVEWNGRWGSSKAGKRTIFTARQTNGVWTEPTPAPFSGGYSDSAPFVSPDGDWLYFVSDRPAGATNGSGNGDIWRYSLVQSGRVKYLSVNSDAPEYSPVVTASGALYFASARPGGFGQGDIYRAAPAGQGFDAAERLGPAINSPTGEWNLWVSADERELIFEASSRPSNVSVSGDLYYSWRTSDDWTVARPITQLNSDGSDLLPRLHPDGKTLFYTTAPIGGHARIQSTDWIRLRRELRAGNGLD